MKNFFAFTLIQMFIALAIIALLAYISIPAYRKFVPNIKLQNEANAIVNSLQEARQKTVTEQKIYLVRFDETANKYQLINQESGEVLSETTLDSSIDLTEIIGLTDNQDAVFNFAGAVSDAGEVHLVNSKGKEAVVSIRPAGFIRKE